MRISTVRYLMKMLLLLLVGAVLLHVTSRIFLEKNSYGKYRNYKAQENVDVLILGSSHSDNGISAQQMENYIQKHAGVSLSVFNYSIYGMRIEQMYYFMREVLKEKSPDLIILETFAFVPIAENDREILARRAFDVFPLSRNKLDAIGYCVTEDRWSYYLPIMKYHSRWKELTGADVRVLFDRSLWQDAGKKLNGVKAAMEREDAYFDTDTSLITETEEINDTERESLEKLLALAEEKKIRILFASVPFKTQLGMDSLRMIRINNYLAEHYTDGADVRLLDMNRLWKQLDFDYDDLYNEGHCNKSGAKKVTKCLSEYLTESYDLSGWAQGGEKQ